MLRLSNVNRFHCDQMARLTYYSIASSGTIDSKSCTYVHIYIIDWVQWSYITLFCEVKCLRLPKDCICWHFNPCAPIKYTRRSKSWQDLVRSENELHASFRQLPLTKEWAKCQYPIYKYKGFNVSISIYLWKSNTINYLACMNLSCGMCQVASATVRDCTMNI